MSDKTLNNNELAWKADAEAINLDDIDSSYIIRDDTINQFLNIGNHDRSLFLIGPKGSGKTLLLRYKAYKYARKNEKNDGQKLIFNSGGTSLTDKMVFHIQTLSANDLNILLKPQVWSRIWSFSLSLIIARNGIESGSFPKKLIELENRFSTGFKLSDVVERILNNISTYVTSNFFRDYHTDVSAATNLVKSGFVMFIDRLDQALNDMLKEKEYNYHNGKSDAKKSFGGNISFEIWRIAQFSLLKECYNINSKNPHIKIYATSRIEAFNVEDELKQNIEGFSTELQYNKADLKEIFLNNVRLSVKGGKTVDIDEKELLKKTIGFSEMTHRIAKDMNDNYLVESVFDFVLRHTFAKPREIVSMGGKIFKKNVDKSDWQSKSEKEKTLALRNVVNKHSSDTILKDYKAQIVPSFNNQYLDHFAKNAKSNVISEYEIETIDKDVQNYLYRLGLLGYVNHQLKQIFLEAGKYVYSDGDGIQKSEYYLSHPSLDTKLLEENKGIHFYTKNNIIGNNNSFNYPQFQIAYHWWGKQLHYFLPNKLNGNLTLFKISSCHKLKIPLNELYNATHQSILNTANHKYLQEELQAILHKLSLYLNIRNVSLIEKGLAIKLDKKRKKYLTVLEDYDKPPKYSKLIENSSLPSQQTFVTRLKGRLLTLGLYLYGMMDSQEIHSMIVHHTLSPKISLENSHTYLRNAFYIDKLKIKGCPSSSNWRVVRSSLSDFERDVLDDWWRNYNANMRIPDYGFEENHRDYIEKQRIVPIPA